MKIKFAKYLAFAIFGSALLFTACEEDPIVYDEPTIEFANDVGTSTVINFNQTEGFVYNFSITITGTADAGIQEVKGTRTKLLGTTTVEETNLDYSSEFLNQTTFSKTVTDNIQFLHFMNFDKIEYKFWVTDKEGNIADKTFTVTENTPFPTAKDGYFFHIAGLLHGAYDLENDVTVASGGAAENKHMINTDVAGQAFTGKWTSGNDTKYFKLNTYNYETALAMTAMRAFNAETASIDVAAPAANDIYIALKGDKYFVVKVTAVLPTFDTGTGGNKGKIEFSYKKF